MCNKTDSFRCSYHGWVEKTHSARFEGGLVQKWLTPDFTGNFDFSINIDSFCIFKVFHVNLTAISECAI